jgi:hypothetical protein
MRAGTKEIEIRNIDQLTRSWRFADDHNDLFTVLNRVQENIIRNGFYFFAKNEENVIELVKARKISKESSAVAIQVNKALWDIAEKYAA